MNIGEVLSRAWQIIWKHKVLWIFGIMAGCTGAGSSAGSNSGYRMSYDVDAGSAVNSFFNFQLEPWAWAVIVVAVLVFVVTLGLLMIILGTVGRIALIRGTQQAEQGKEKLSFGELFKNSFPYFWRLLGMYILMMIVTFLGVIIIGIPLAVITCGIGVFAIAAALLLVNVLMEQASCAIVIENLGVLDSLKRGWYLVKNNLGRLFVMGLILVVGISLIAVFVVGIPLALLSVPLITGFVLGSKEAIGGGALVSALCFVGFIPLLLVLVGIMKSYISAAWTLTYLRLTGIESPAVISEALPPPL